MSKWLDFSDAIKARIQATVEVCDPERPDAQRVEVIVDRQLNIGSLVQLASARPVGAVITILWEGGKNPAPDQDTLQMGGGYVISVKGAPILNAAGIPLDELTEQVCQAIHGFQPSERQARLRERLRVLDVGIGPDERLLTYEITADVKRL